MYVYVNQVTRVHIDGLICAYVNDVTRETTFTKTHISNRQSARVLLHLHTYL
jgi:hypothetical protein